jgi:putative phage-type endonuclease
MIVDVQQQTPEWLEMRHGTVTASRVADVMAKLKNGGEAAVRASYKAELLCERLTHLTYEHYVSPSMQWGIDNEPLAKASYEIATGFAISSGGLAMHPKIKWLMASPDGLVHDDGLVECKCPNTSTHLDYILAGVVPPEYHWQMLCQMACAERKWCDFVSYDPRLPESLQLFIRRLEWDGERIAKMEQEVEKFIGEIEDEIILLSKSKLIDLDPSLIGKLKESVGDA